MSSNIFNSIVICLAGFIKRKGSAVNQTKIRAQITDAGGEWTSDVDGRCTHLVATPKEVENQSQKVRQAEQIPGLKIVHPDWVFNSIELQQLEDADKYLYSNPTTNANGKRAGSPVPDNAVASKVQKKPKPPAPSKDEQGAAESKKKISPDPGSPYVASHHVYTANDGMIYDATLNLSFAGLNANKFYTIQVLQGIDPDDHFAVWQRWGRVGEKGQGQPSDFGNDREKAIKKFKQVFRSKTGLKWEKRSDDPIQGKYAFVEKSYEDSDDEDDVDKGANGGEKQAQHQVEQPESQLHPHIQTLMRLIFNHGYFHDTMASLSYDANKLPLGKLSNRTLLGGFEILKQLADIIANESDVQQKALKCSTLSNQYFTLIPHALGRRAPPVIVYADQVKKETELLNNLSEMEIANEIMKIAGRVDNQAMHFLDSQYKGLNLNEMTSLDPSTTEYTELKNYLEGSSGSTHSISYQPKHIFRVSRAGEEERYQNSPYAGSPNSHRLLLWHGSRSTNYGGILSQGLRIAPPEAPVTGYMFGKGVYFADCSTKSANYCFPRASGFCGALLLCEVDVGPVPMYEPSASEPDAGQKAAAAGKTATLGKGQRIPGKWKDAGCVSDKLKGVSMPDCGPHTGSGLVNRAESKEGDSGFLQYNEYIVYDVRQIRVRYLVLSGMTDY